ncbi:DUF1810 family protein [Luteitalea pratensis]|nr:DUF1810 family protein [Luteitalea pratensis]
MSRLDRFREAQNSSHAGFESALAELRSGGKRGHWIWYVFPQIDGLGMSGMSQAFAIDGEDEAAAFLRDAELRSRLLTITSTVAEQLSTGRVSSLRTLMGSDIDAMKVVSSLTLFGHVARKLNDIEGLDAYGAMARVADDVLAMAESQGYPPCAHTLRRLRATA